MIPNILTTLRLVIIPIFAYTMLKTDNMFLAFVLFIASGITDVVDGYIARRFNMTTDIGKIYDPFVDKLMQLTALFCLTVKGVVPIWIIVIVAVKETAMIITGSVLYIKKIVVHSNWYGKAATALFYVVITLLIVFEHISSGVKAALVLFLAVAAVLTAIGYLIKVVGYKSGEICDKKLEN